MPNEERMTLNERRKYLRLIKERYLKASKLGRGRKLDEMEAITGLHRKSLIRLMSGSLEREPRHKQRGRTYGPEVDHALRVISESFEHVCAERLQPNLVWMATHLARHGYIEASELLLDQSSRISVSTVRGIVACACGPATPAPITTASATSTMLLPSPCLSTIPQRGPRRPW